MHARHTGYMAVHNITKSWERRRPERKWREEKSEEVRVRLKRLKDLRNLLERARVRWMVERKWRLQMMVELLVELERLQRLRNLLKPLEGHSESCLCRRCGIEWNSSW
jgi:hypothetical protein